MFVLQLDNFQILLLDFFQELFLFFFVFFKYLFFVCKCCDLVLQLLQKNNLFILRTLMKINVLFISSKWAYDNWVSLSLWIFLESKMESWNYLILV